MQSNINSTYFPGQNPNFAAYPNNPQINAGAKKIEDNTLLKQAQKTQDNPAVLIGGALGFGIPLLWASSVLNKQLRGNYDDTFFGKIEQFGDRLGNKPALKSTGTKLAAFNEWFKNNVVNKSEILRSIWTKPSVGGSMAQGQATGTMGHLATSARELMEAYDKAHGTTVFKDILEKTAKDSHKYTKEIFEALKAHPETHAEFFNTSKAWVPMPKFLQKGGTLGEIYNKMRLTQNYKNITNSLGKKLSGGTFRALEALSNGMAGGKLAVALQAFFLAQSLKEGLDAPKGDRFKTFAESMASFMAMMLTMGLQLRVFNKAAGLKNIGMSPENYKKYHETIEKLNAAGKAGDEAAYKTLKAELKNIKSGKVKFWQKPFKWVGNLLSWGRIKETVRPLKSTNPLKNAIKMTGYGAKIGAGYVGRFAFIATVVMSLFTDTAVKISHKIFGRPQKSILDKEEEPKTDEQANAQQLEELKKEIEAEMAAKQTAQAAQQAQNINYKKGDLLTNMQKPRAQQPIASQSLAAQSVAKTENTELPELKRTYIPSPILGPEAEISPAESRTARIDAVLRQADLAEAQAQRFFN
ncbi:TPA: hypothetical protein IAD52_06955 [Candidatus Spyradomonas excrementavium]|nr:hypothetical protein [Candidatus Spyradomonas excrementavium]